MKKMGFTLIEIAAVIVILLILLGISIPMLNKGSSHHEAKMSANSLQSLISLVNSMARSAGKVYLIDFNVTSQTIQDHDANARSQFSIVRVYSSAWDGSKIVHTLVNESIDIPVGIVATVTDVSAATKSDHIYFKPDGQVSTEVDDFMIWPESSSAKFFKINLDTDSGNTLLTDFRQN